MFRSFLPQLSAALVLPVFACFALAAETAVQESAAPAKDNQKSMLEVVKELEKNGYAPICEISFDDGVWEVEAYKEDMAYELSVDPSNGEVISEHRDNGDTKPPAKAMLLSAIIEALEKKGYTHLHDLSFEHRTWEAEVRLDGMKRELRVDPLSGEIVEDRVDD